MSHKMNNGGCRYQIALPIYFADKILRIYEVQKQKLKIYIFQHSLNTNLHLYTSLLK